MAWLLVGFHLLAAPSPAAPISFNREIRPILSEHCFACHGPDEKARRGGLRLDREDDARVLLDSGHRALVAGDPQSSALVARILTEDPDDRMPPAETKKPLNHDQIAVLQRWVAEGAKYEGHWAYVSPHRPDPPQVSDPAWPRSDLDRFVLARLDQEGLRPSPEAPKEKLLRRVSLDLTGLPPTPEELDAFLADPSPKAYETVVDRLLASPHYGERMAQQWLDLARYGETQGYHHDRHRDQWHWRDWVIEAFNRNQPFDRFTIEQLAGDLLPSPTREQLIATGFHRNEMTTSEGGALPEEYLVKYAVGRVDTTARVWLGTSMACAECHEHKYDPISQREFYEFFAFFYNTPENGLDQEALNPVPRVTLETPADRARADQLDREVSALEAAEQLVFEAPREEWDRAEAEWIKRHRTSSVGGWQPLVAGAATVRRTAGLDVDPTDGWIPLGVTQDASTIAEITLTTGLAAVTALRFEVMPFEPAAAKAPSGNGEAATEDAAAGLLLSHLDLEVSPAEPLPADATAEPMPPGAWRVVGPFRAGSRAETVKKEFDPEKTWDLGASYENGKLPWQEREATREHGIRLEGAQAAHYLARLLEAPSPRVVDALIAFDGDIRVWLNGRSCEVSGEGAAQRVRLWLRPGENRLLVKAVTREPETPWAFRFAPEPVTRATIRFAGAAGNGPDGKFPPRGALDDGPGTGWSIVEGGKAAARREAIFMASDPFGFPGGTRLRLRLTFAGDHSPLPGGSLRVSVSGSPTLEEFVALPEGVRAALYSEAGTWTPGQGAEVRRFYRGRFIGEADQTRQLLAAKRKERDDFRNAWPTAMVMREATPARETQIRVRGRYDQLGELVQPGVPGNLFAWVETLPRNRLGLAKWLVDPRHPLTARVVVNQYWQKYFGVGLVKTSEDFGSQGEWPSHPQLLDWLATEFVRTGWDVKAMQRLLVTSATYRQDSVVTPELIERDPENRLLARGPRFRLEAENIRDLALAASGLLNPKVGGPSVFPYQPPGLWGQVSFEGTRDYVQSEGEGNYRRGLYTYWRRSIPYASFTIFDAPSREVCTVRRPRTNTPLQALALLNDPVYVEAARALAERVLRWSEAEGEDRLAHAFRRVLGRRPTAAERELLKAACARELRRFAEDRAAASRLIHVGASRPAVDLDPAELAAWTVVANTLLNLDEAITKG